MTKQTLKLSTAALVTVAVAMATGLASRSGAETNASPTKSSDRLTDLFGDAVVAKGKGVEVKRSQLDPIVISYKAAAAANGQVIPPEQMPYLEQRVLNDLIAMQLLLSKATDDDKAKGKEQFETTFKKLKAESLKADPNLTDADFDEKFDRQLRAQGLTREQWNKQRLDQTIAASALERELKISISDEDAKKYYEEYPARFEEPETVHVSHILLTTKDTSDNTPNPAMRKELSEGQKQAKRKQIEEILKRARAGEDFAKLAKEFSEDPGMKQNDGEYTFSRDDAFVPEFKAAAFSLSTNQVSDIVTTVYGYHIIKLLEKIPAKKVELAKVSDRVKEGLKQQEMQKRLPDFVEGLRKEANIEILDEKLKPKEGDALIPSKPAKP